MAIIAADNERAVDDYIGATGDRTTPRGILLRAVSDPDAEFTTTPRAMMTYARFMRDTGVLRRTPETVEELFFTLPGGGS